MASREDALKRRAWESRFARYQSSGLTVARFCEQEGVSAHTFYYWARRAGWASVRTPSSAPGSVPRRRPVKDTPKATGICNAALVRFDCDTGMRVSVPADCLDAIRCLAECLRRAKEGRSDAFQEVIVSS